MYKHLRFLPAIFAVVLLVVAGSAGRLQTISAASGTPSPEAPYAPKIDPNDFTNVIDNPYFTLVPGTTFIYEGTEGDEKTRDEVIVTSKTKVVLGVTCVEVHDRVYSDGELAEDTRDWFAQDKAGTVWYFGEATSTLEEGTPTSGEGSWEAGVDGAQPGIIMLADPKVGDTYRQEYYPGHAEDMAEVTAVSGSVDIPYGSFDDVIVTREFTPLEPDSESNRTYARGVGDVKEESTKGEYEVLELVEVKKASAASPEATPST
ncbi:MAG: hypothetical protein ACJ789_17285 [Thermomicrobiales bacterium]